MALTQTQNLFHHHAKNKMIASQMRVVIFPRKQWAKIEKAMSSLLHSWQMDEVKKEKQTYHHFQNSQGHVLLAIAEKVSADLAGDLAIASPNKLRDLMGQVWNGIRCSEVKSVQFEFIGLKENEILSCLRGLALASYSVKNPIKKEFVWATSLDGKALSQKILDQAQAYATASSITRDLVNLPANQLNPKTYAEEIQRRLGKLPHTKIKVHTAAELEKKGHQLILAVGNGALHAPCIVEIDYHPKAVKGDPILFIGKGVTFDSGGLDIKPAEGMRLMKKDMAGSAALVGLASMLAENSIKKWVKIYLCLAENAISEHSYRPGDIFHEPNGIKIEIHNTDAEGRLVMASGMSMAQQHHPRSACLIDVATLTGAMRIALGPQISGMLTNNAKLGASLLQAGHIAGENCWQMPLYRPYISMLKSHVADMVNSAGGHGGGITAALFLEKFILPETKWGHLDIYGHSEQPLGAITEVGANSHPLAMLYEFVQEWK